MMLKKNICLMVIIEMLISINLINAQNQTDELPFALGETFNFTPDQPDAPYIYTIRIYDIPEHGDFRSNPKGVITYSAFSSAPIIGQQIRLHAIIPETVEYKGHTIIIDSIRSCPPDCSYIDFPQTFTEIPDNFASRPNSLLEIALPHNLKRIGAKAFIGCKDLLRIKSLDSDREPQLIEIGDSAFVNCYKLKIPVIFFTNVEHIGSHAFDQCHLDSIALPKIKTIGYRAFSNQKTIQKTLTIPASCESIGSYAFTGIPYRTIVLHAKNPQLGINIFQNCRFLKSITIPDNWEKIPYGFLDECKSLTDINFPSHLKEIDDYAFRSTVLPSVTLPDGLISIGTHAFTYCPIKTVNIPKSVTSLSSGIFFRCKLLEQVHIPIELTYIPDSIFFECGTLKSFEFHSNLKQIGDCAFWGCKSLSGDIIFPESIESIGREAFSFTNISSVKLPSKITKIDGLFKWCTNLKSIEIPQSVTYIGNYTFASCVNLQNITLPNNLTYIGNYAFSSCTNLKEINLPNQLTHIGQFAFSYCTSLQEIIIPPKITTIADHTFNNCTNLTKIQFPKNLINIESNAFTFCTGLEELQTPDNLSSIGSYAFSYCKGLKKIQIPGSVSYIGNYAFCSCDSLTLVQLPSTLKSIEKGTFSSSPNIKDIYLECEQPPHIETTNYNSIFSKAIFESAILHIPLHSISRYLANAFWRQFKYFDDPSSGVENVSTPEEPAISITTEGATLSGADNMQVSVYATDGRLVYTTVRYDGSPLPLNRGQIYIVVAGGKHLKVAL